VDLGVVAKTYRLPAFAANKWLASPTPGTSERSKYLGGDRYLFAEIAAAPDAAVTLRNRRSGRVFTLDLSEVRTGTEATLRSVQPRIEWIEPHKSWVRTRILDSSTDRPTPACISFRAANGRYIPPYGHRSEINEGWFQDYGYVNWRFDRIPKPWSGFFEYFGMPGRLSRKGSASME
jgi:hypothetical protein